MSERLPYEEIDRQFSDLPVPDEEASWQKMKERLDRDDDDGTIVPPVLLRSCTGWGLFLLAGLIVAWLVVRPDRWWTQSQETHRSSKIARESTEKQNQNTASAVKHTQQPQVADSARIMTPGKTGAEIPSYVQPSVSHPGRVSATLAKGAVKNKKVTTTVASPMNDAAPGRQAKPGIVNINSKGIETQKQMVAGSDSSSSTMNQQQDIEAKDFSQKTTLPQPTESSPQKKPSTSSKKLIAAAGLGLQQLVPIAGQSLAPYSYYGRHGSWADYIPSVYLQVHKKGKWFVMAEFRYGAAQSVKEFSYNRKTRYDTATMSTTVTTMRLKKTYYHQLPFSFNYYVLPNLSIGIGGMYSHFYGAVTEKETDTWNNLTQKYTNLKQIIPVRHFNDSFLFKTQVHVLLQADYQWKRFSFELRYSRDVQPYIKYTMPDGTVDEKRNQALQLMVRYRLWQSGKL